MNDEILITVCGGASNKEVSNLAEILRIAARCTGKIVALKCTPEVLAEIKRLTEIPESRTVVRHRNSGSWASDKRS